MRIPAKNLANLHLLSHPEINQDYRLQVAFPALTNQDQPIDLYNRGLRDLFLLLTGDWSENMGWSFVEIHQLAQQAKGVRHEPPLGVPAEQWESLCDLIQTADKETLDSYAAFTEYTQKPAEPDDFLIWFYHHLPYMTLGLDSYEEGKQRLIWFMQDLPDMSLEESLRDFGLRELLHWWVEQKNIADHT